MHTLRKAQHLLEERCVRQLDLPPRRADMKLCENVWGLVKLSLAKHSVVNAWTVNDLWQAIHHEWGRLRRDPELVRILYMSQMQKIKAARAAAGNMTRY